MKRLLCLGCCLLAAVVSADDASIWEFYQRNPQFQGWFPFGIYAGGATNLLSPGTTKQERSEWMVDLQALQGCNVIWGQSPTRHNIATDGAGNPIDWNAFGKWFYGTSLPEREMRIWPSLVHWLRYSLPVWGDLQRMAPLPTDAELLAKAEALAPVLDFARRMRAEYPDTVVGYIIDDEPHMLAASVAAQRLLRDRAGVPAMTCKPSWGGFQSFVGHMQPMTGDFYVTQDGGDNSWEIAERMTWIRKNLPQRVFHFLPLASAYRGAHEQTLPGLRDSRPSTEDLRMQFWMSLAGGCKGYYYYHLVYNTWWARGEDNLLNLVLEPNGGLWPELKRLAAVATTVGPCLVPCRSLDPVDIGIDCGSVRFIEYQGPAIGVGLLQDIPRPKRHFVVPWNNDLRAKQTGILTLPPELLAGRLVYDLHDLREVALRDSGFTVSLEPGGGRVFLLGTAEDFADCAETICQARVRQPRVTARIRRRLLARQPGARTTSVDAFIAEAQVAEKAKDWDTARARYGAAVNAVDEQEKSVRHLLETRRQLDQLAAVLSITDDLLRTHAKVLDINSGARSLQAHHYQNPRVGPSIREFVVLVGQYLDSRIAERKGELDGQLLRDRATVLTQQAEANRKRIRAAINAALSEKRLPLRIACFTPDRYVVEYNMNVAWLHKNATTGWFVPDPDGIWRDRQGKAWKAGEWDVVWVQQLLFADPTATRLLPALSAQQNVLTDFVRNGGGLLLTGVAGLLAQELGAETVLPDRVRENSPYAQSLTVGLASAPGMAKHPILASLHGKFVYTNASFPDRDYFAEVAWEERQPTGRVIATEYDQLFGPIGTYAAIVEYALGKGKILVAGGRACDLTPGHPYGLKDMRPGNLRANLRAVIRDALVYAASAERFTPDPAAVVAAGTPRERPQCLPLADWEFRLDPEKVGEKQKWMAPKPAGDWKTISIGANWESQGYDYNGVAWYRRTVSLRNRPGKHTILHFGAVDEQATVYIDGKRVGHNQGGPEGWEAWDQPFAMDITGFLTDADATHLLAVRVFDISSAGGIWKPVWLEYESR